MNYGKFFRLNNDKSDLGSGMTVFDYLWLCDAAHKDGSPEYPIYLTITRESIDFHVHYFDERKDGGERGTNTVKHLHNVLLSLPLSDNMDVKDGLTGALVEGYETNFPTWEKEGSNYLFKLLVSTIRDHDGIQGHSYSTLKEFHVNIEELREIFGDVENIIKDDIKKYKIAHDKAFDQCIERLREGDLDGRFVALTKKIEKYKRDIFFIFSRFIRKLILDFIFDLEQTHVFHISPYYESVSIRLKSNYFFSALAAKANFYYQKKNLRGIKWILKEKREKYYFDWSIASDEEYCDLHGEIVRLKVRIQELAKNQNLSIDTEYYLKSELEWTKQIRDPRSEENFNGYQDKWFKDPEEEMKAVYCARREVFRAQLARVKTGNEKGRRLIKRYRIDKTLSDKWRVAHYDLWNWRCLVFPRLFISTVAAWLTFILGSGLWGNISDGGFQKITTGYPYVVNGFYILLVSGSFYWILHSGLKHKIAVSVKNRFGYWLSSAWITAMGFCYSFLIGLLLTIFIYEQESGKDEIPHFGNNGVDIFNHPVPYLWVGVCLSMFIGLVIQSFMDNKPPTASL
ncbi:MAG: ABC transporter permease [Odoribacteraceae bacterium]|jgi:hypothetical protein|nr:ABC transporter permease [Odoribacteraceae bacterium]